MANQSGNARAMFIDSWVVGVNVYGSRPRRLIVSRRIISDDRMRAHLWPGLFSGVMSCLVIVLMVHDCKVDRRLVAHRLFGVGRRSVGSSIDSKISGIPSRCGLENWSKKLMIMVRFRGCFWWLWVFCWWGDLWG